MGINVASLSLTLNVMRYIAMKYLFLCNEKFQFIAVVPLNYCQRYVIVLLNKKNIYITRENLEGDKSLKSKNVVICFHFLRFCVSNSGPILFKLKKKQIDK